MRNFQDTFETHKQSFNSAFSICMTVALILEAKFGDILLSIGQVGKECMMS